MKTLGVTLFVICWIVLWIWAGMEFGNEYGGVGKVLGFFIPFSGWVLPFWFLFNIGFQLPTLISLAVWLIGAGGLWIKRRADMSNRFAVPRKI